MTALAQGGASSAALPRVVATWIVDGFLTDLDDEPALEFRLVDSQGGATSWLDTTTKLGTGRYLLIFELAEDAELGVSQAEWRAGEQTGVVRFDVVELGEPIPNAYATVTQARDEGVPSTFTDDRVARALERASREIEQLTRRRFGPRYETIRFDGTDAAILPLDREIIGLDTLVLDGYEVEHDLLAVTTGFYDTGANKIEWRDPADQLSPGIRNYLAAGSFTRGKANVVVSALWGYVEPAPWGDLAGTVPTLIIEATVRLAMRRVRRSWSALANGQAVLGPISAERTRSQSVSYGKANNAITAWTGDPEVDRIISQYRAGFLVRIV